MTLREMVANLALSFLAFLAIFWLFEGVNLLLMGQLSHGFMGELNFLTAFLLSADIYWQLLTGASHVHGERR